MATFATMKDLTLIAVTTTAALQLNPCKDLVEGRLFSLESLMWMLPTNTLAAHGGTICHVMPSKILHIA